MMTTRQSHGTGKHAGAAIGLAVLMTAAGVAQAHTSFDTAVAEHGFNAISQGPHSGTRASARWNEFVIADESAHDRLSPAPIVTLTAQATGTGGGHDHNAMAMGSPTDAQTVRAGALEISGGGVKAMLPGAKVGGGGLVIRNTGTTDDRLVSVTSPAAGRVELHEMTMVGDVMKMRPIEGGVALPAGETVELTGKLHLMFMDVASAFAEGQTVPVTLTFEKAGNVDYVLPVGNAAGAHK